jgi:hypothetical protein
MMHAYRPNVNDLGDFSKGAPLIGVLTKYPRAVGVGIRPRASAAGEQI